MPQFAESVEMVVHVEPHAVKPVAHCSVVPASIPPSLAEPPPVAELPPPTAAPPAVADPPPMPLLPQVPFVQPWPVPHVVHSEPLTPHATIVTPDWHSPLLSQQPAHVDGPHRRTGCVHDDDSTASGRVTARRNSRRVFTRAPGPAATGMAPQTPEFRTIRKCSPPVGGAKQTKRASLRAHRVDGIEASRPRCWVNAEDQAHARAHDE